MKLTVKATDLRRAFTSIKGAVAGMSTIPILSCVALSADGGSLCIEASDCSKWARASVPCEGAGSLCVDANKLWAFISAAKDGDVTIIADGPTAEIKCGRVKASMPWLPIEDWPGASLAPEKDEWLSLDGKAFRKALSQAAAAVSTEQTRPYLCGVHLYDRGGKFTLESSNGHSGHVATCGHSGSISCIGGPKGCIVPTDVIGMITEEDCRLHFEGSILFVKQGNIMIRAKTIDATFPDLHMAIRHDHLELRSSMDVDRESLLAAIKPLALAAASQKEARVIHVYSDDDTAVVFFGHSGGSMEVPFETDGKADFVIVSNLLVSTLGVMDEEVVNISTYTGGDLIVVKGAGSFWAGIMGIRASHAQRRPSTEKQLEAAK